MVKLRHYHKRAFTLMEMLIAMTIFFVMITTVTSIFIYIYKTKGSLEARQGVTKESYFFLEKLQVMIKDYTIDYEEYRNRKQTGCTIKNNALRSGTSNCTIMTYYGNNNSISDPYTSQNMFYCSSQNKYTNNGYLIGKGGVNANGGLDIIDCMIGSTNGVVSNTNQQIANSGFIQSYGQYAKLFWDVKDDVDYIPGPVKDDDDVDIGIGPEAVYRPGGVYPQELYLISHDKQRRLFIRRKLIGSGDFNGDNLINKDSEKLYSIQILQLRGLDAGENHNFDIPSTGLYDGVIDTWACDIAQGFVCKGANVNGAYSGYRLPLSGDDGWQDILNNDITIADWNIIISPVVDPKLGRKDESVQLNPSFTIQMTSKLYGKNRGTKIPPSQMENYSLRLQTSFSFNPVSK